MPVIIARDMETLQEALAELATSGKRVALVPTMGALHEGHQALIRQAADLADAVVVSIFVNPRQFGPAEDFAKYPRMLNSDVKKAHEAGASLVYAPEVEDLYPGSFSTTVSVGSLGTILCGKFRPGHFDGVATVVTKLLLRVLPHVAVFGVKDYQQLCVIQRVVNDLDIAVDIAGVETVREADGLALSSRNAYLSPEERAIAPKLYETLSAVGTAIAGGANVKAALEQSITGLTKAGFKVDYLELRNAETLEEMQSLQGPARLLAAAWLGKTRLIDNIEVE
jgi:pantoate--beta-alanine ligase